MKKIIVIVLLAMGGIFLPNALGNQNNVPMQIIKEGPTGNIGTYIPARPWYIIQNDYVLTLPAFEDEYTFELRDEYGTVVYSTYLPAETTTVILPTTLSGDFEIRLVADNYYYRGHIEL